MGLPTVIDPVWEYKWRKICDTSQTAINPIKTSDFLDKTGLNFVVVLVGHYRGTLKLSYLVVFQKHFIWILYLLLIQSITIVSEKIETYNYDILMNSYSDLAIPFCLKVFSGCIIILWRATCFYLLQYYFYYLHEVTWEASIVSYGTIL